jgi:hypothetical protein
VHVDRPDAVTSPNGTYVIAEESESGAAQRIAIDLSPDRRWRVGSHTKMTNVLADAVRSALAELSDGEYQARIWTGQDPRGETSSFVECVARLYDDSGLEDPR